MIRRRLTFGAEGFEFGNYIGIFRGTRDLTVRNNQRSQSQGSKRSAKNAGREDDKVAKNAVAVALSYVSEGYKGAPKVVASGRGWFAEKILEIAFANDVKVREDPDLAEMLAAVDLDSEIPVEAFIAVTEILR
jgi:flagellar biosynthesis protein